MIYLLINHKILSYNGYYKIIYSANIKKLSQYRYWLSFFILAEFMILYCKDSLGCIDNNNIELINNVYYIDFQNFLYICFYLYISFHAYESTSNDTKGLSWKDLPS